MLGNMKFGLLIAAVLPLPGVLYGQSLPLIDYHAILQRPRLEPYYQRGSSQLHKAIPAFSGVNVCKRMAGLYTAATIENLNPDRLGFLL
jgi:hypothetical protein